MSVVAKTAKDNGLSSLKDMNITDKVTEPLKNIAESATDRIQFGPANLINNELGDDLINQMPKASEMGNHFIQL